MTSSDPGVMPNLWTSLGKLVVSSGSLEETVRGVVLNMMGGPHWRRTGLVIDGYSASQMNGRVERLAYQVLADSLQGDVLKWIQQVAKVQTRRNSIIHSSWSHVLVADGLTVLAATSSKVPNAKRGLEMLVKEWTPSEIDNVTAEISRVDLVGCDLTVELQDFSLAEGRHSPDLAPWSRQSPPPDRGSRQKPRLE
jgi:hypothetical protein